MEKKNNTGLLILVILLVLIAGSIGWYAGSQHASKEDKLSTKENKESKKEKEKDKEKTTDKKESKLIYLDSYVNDFRGLYGFYDDGTVKLLSDKVLIDRYTIDGNIVYYTNAKGELCSFDITKLNEKHKEYDVVVEDGGYFSVNNNKLFNIVRAEDKDNLYFAITYDLVTGKESKEELTLNAAHVNGLVHGNKFLIDDRKYGNIKPYYYLYDFSNNKLTKYDSYNNVVENRENYVLFEKDASSDCLYDKNNEKELFCVNRDKNNKRVYGTLPTTKNGKIYTLDGNKIKECSADNNCKEVFYTLTDEEANAPYLSMRYIGDSFLLTVGLNEKCEEGCSYDLTTYDLNNNHKKMDYFIDISGYYQGLFLE